LHPEKFQIFGFQRKIGNLIFNHLKPTNMGTIIFIVILVFILYALFSKSEAVKNWGTLVPNMQYDPGEFYELVEDILKERKIPGIKTDRRTFKEGGVLSSHRLYLEVSRGDFIFHICGAPWGTGFFFSWWVRKMDNPFENMLANLPFVGKAFSQSMDYNTYYKLDTDTMFRSSVHQCVLAAIDKLTEAKGMRGLTELERTADLRMIGK
jgi:cell division protein FtsW (lipid II flippase)